MKPIVLIYATLVMVVAFKGAAWHFVVVPIGISVCIVTLFLLLACIVAYILELKSKRKKR